MKNLTIFKKAAVGIVALATSLLMNGAAVSAIPYTGDSTPPSPVPAFNVFTGVPNIGNESDFLRSRVPTSDSDSSTPYVDPLSTSCANGQKIQMRVYVHNGASQDANNGGSGPSVAHNVKVKVNLDNSTAKSTFDPSATISSSNAGVVTDGAVINCNGKSVKLKYVFGSASAFSIGTGVVAVNEGLLLTTGAPIRSQAVAGDVWGCWNERVYLIFTVQVEEVPETPPSLGECKTVTFDVDNKTRKVSVSNIQANLTNATVVGYKIDFGEGTVSTAATADHVFTADSGTITVSVQIQFADSHTELKTAAGCIKQVNFTKTPTTPTPTPTPTTLPNTGPGDVAGIFAAVTVAGALFHKYVLSRRYQ